MHHNLHPTSVKLIEGELLEVVSYKVDMRGKHLAWLLERIDKQRHQSLAVALIDDAHTLGYASDQE